MRARPVVPRTESAEPASVALLAVEHDDAALPDEARARVVEAEAAPTPQVEAAPGQALHVAFGFAAQETLVDALATLRELFRTHPGDTPVVLHIPAGHGRDQEMELRRGVAYDAELRAEVTRRFGDGLLSLSLR